MKKILAFITLSAAAMSCTLPAPVVQANQVPMMVEDHFIRLQDAFYLRPGMEYSEVKSILKQNPYELYQNIEDNCVVISYYAKRNMRVHTSTQNPVPMAYYASEDPTNLTYEGSIPFYVILDGETKVVRAFFSEPDADKIEAYTRMLRRAKKVCDNPEKVDAYMKEWFDENPGAPQSDKILRLPKLGVMNG